MGEEVPANLDQNHHRSPEVCNPRTSGMRELSKKNLFQHAITVGKHTQPIPRVGGEDDVSTVTYI
jgi:hypothetical protein